MTTLALDTPVQLSLRLRQDTAAQHERMHQLMAAGQPLARRDAYAGFVTAQYLFQREVEALFQDPLVIALVPDLAVRGRLQAARQDLADLQAPLPDESAATATPVARGAAALGWLYVSEGSTLGAAFLLKSVQANLGLSADFGARHLAAYPEGRALVWRRFVAALDSDQLDAHAADEVLAGANAAYDRFGHLLEQHLPSQ